jgi:hypothetical protein
VSQRGPRRHRPAVNIPEGGIADTRGFFQHGVKYGLQIAWKAADDLEHIRRGRLLLQCLGKVSGALAEVVSALTEFVEQPRVLDGDDGLSGEVLYQRGLLFTERPDFSAIDNKGTDKLIVLQHRHAQKRSCADSFNERHDAGTARNV